MSFGKLVRFGVFICIIAFYSSIAASEPLERRNPYQIENFVESEKFVIYWGEGVLVSDAMSLLETLEYTWVRMIEEMNFERPLTMQNYKLNVYISGTGQVPYNDEQGGLAILDKQEHEAFILNKEALGKEKVFLGATHEFFHTIQSSYGLIRSDAMRGIGWLGEALANWSVPIVWEEHETLAVNALAQYAFYPQYSLDHISPSRAGDDYYLLSGHQYGTYLLFDHLIEKTGDPNFVRRFMEHLKPLAMQTEQKDALEELEVFTLNNYGLQLKALFASFIARNSEWDYPAQNTYHAALAEQRKHFPDEKVAHTLYKLDNQWHSAPQKTLPRRWAANYIKLQLNEINELEVGFEGNIEGSNGNASDWKVTLVISRADGFEYIPLTLQDGKIAGFSVSTNSANTVWLAISVTSESKNVNEEFAYRYQLAQPGKSQPSPNSVVTYQPKVEPQTPTGSSGGGSMSFYFLLLIFYMCRRKGYVALVSSRSLSVY
ncbi:DUF6055 domain-containing protein [Aliikangiella sp. IMCC44359]|uniref:DUF6055 domain-containing protein n=1 Tax=Aliikangiella sp. IMCC44359 TaxID=3459125 RepID=UPI00403A8C47